MLFELYCLYKLNQISEEAKKCNKQKVAPPPAPKPLSKKEKRELKKQMEQIRKEEEAMAVMLVVALALFGIIYGFSKLFGLM